jgi:hypothetical protein
MGDVAAGLKARGHDEMALVAVQPGQKGDAGLVEPGGCAKDLARQGDGRGQQAVIGGVVAQGQRLQRLAAAGAMAAKMPRRRGNECPVAFDQRRIVEIVAGIKPDASGQAGAERLFMGLIQQGNLDAVHLGRVFRDELQDEIGRLASLRCPSSRAGQGRTSRPASAGSPAALRPVDQAR